MGGIPVVFDSNMFTGLKTLITNDMTTFNNEELFYER